MLKDRGRYKKIIGTTLIEALTVLFIFSLITLSFYEVFSLGTRYIQNSKNRLTAISIANEKMEIARNISYNKIDIVGNSSDAVLLADSDVSEGGRSFHVNTVVDQIDDDLDGLYPTDTVPNDYKKVTINISWEGSGIGDNSVVMTSRFVPPGLEVMNSGDGILSINVFSDQPGGVGIAGSSVHIVNSETGLDVNRTTDSAGNIILVGSKVTNSIQKYEISVVKSGYESVQTMPPYPSTLFNPVNVHASVISGAVNVANIVQNELANIRISTVDYLDQPISGVDFNMTGGKILGHNMESPYDPVYNFNSDSATDSSGIKEFNNISPGGYTISLLDPSLEQYEIISADPDWPFALMSADGTLDVKIRLAAKNVTSLLAQILQADDDIPIEGAVVKVTNLSGYEKTVSTTARGKAFFPADSDVFSSGNYHVEVKADGFSDANVDLTVNDGELKLETIRMSAI